MDDKKILNITKDLFNKTIRDAQYAFDNNLIKLTNLMLVSKNQKVSRAERRRGYYAFLAFTNILYLIIDN